MDDVKFCLAVKDLDSEKRDAVWAKRRAEEMARRRSGRCSEDVWRLRRVASEQGEGTLPSG